MEPPIPIMKGNLDGLVLKALVDGPMHGFEICSWLEARSGGRLDLTDSALYQALYRMEERGLIEASWGMTGNNRRARYYELLPAGEKHLATETHRWVEYAHTVTEILTTQPPPEEVES